MHPCLLILEGVQEKMDSICTLPCAAIPKVTRCARRPSLPEKKIKSQSPGDAEQGAKVLMDTGEVAASSVHTA